MSEDHGSGLSRLLDDFERDSGIRASAIVSRDGLVMASKLPAGIDEDTVAANAARILFLGEATGKELSRGNLTQVLLAYDDGSIALSGAGPYAAVMALVDKESKLESGAVLFAIKTLANKVQSLLEG
ncbi:MAG: roadblock/LC7 domain-containing protein [Candidatus Helarchaeota archaeon]